MKFLRSVSCIMYNFCHPWRSDKAQRAVYGGRVVGESAFKTFNEVGPKVHHIYEVFNEGPWKVSTLDVVILWPFQVANDKPQGKWLLYLEEVPLVTGKSFEEKWQRVLEKGIITNVILAPNGGAVGGECRVDSVNVNPVTLKPSVGMEDLDPSFSDKPNTVYNNNNQSNFVRRKRDTEKVVASKIVIDGNGHKETIVSMVCILIKFFSPTNFILKKKKKKFIIPRIARLGPPSASR